MCYSHQTTLLMSCSFYYSSGLQVKQVTKDQTARHPEEAANRYSLGTACEITVSSKSQCNGVSRADMSLRKTVFPLLSSSGL